MSRIIVKNLPKAIKEERLRRTFTEKGDITDLSMKYTKDGVFRKFAFIGFKTPKQAEEAVQFYNKSFIDTSRIQVEIAKDLTDLNKSRPWSKYSEGSSAFNKRTEKSEEKDLQKDKKKKAADLKKKNNENVKKKEKELLGDLADDPEFQEFIDVHKNRLTKSTWTNDTMDRKDGMIGQDDADDSSDTSSDEEDAGNEGSTKEDKKSSTTADEGKTRKKDTTLSDVDYLKSKFHKTPNIDQLSDSDSPDTEQDDTSQEKKVNTSKTNTVMINMRGLPVTIKEKQVKEFFSPLKVKSVQIPRNANKKVIGIAKVIFQSDEDGTEAMKKNKGLIEGKRIFLKKQVTSVEQVKTVDNSRKPWEEKAKELEHEDIESVGESGRLYLRNLCYTCTEEELEQHFGTYGPLTEVHLPLDKFTKKVKGFAFITYMIPEHAVKAFTSLDGTVFQGRMLHILPAKAKKETEIQVTDDVSFKKKQDIKKKASAGSSHNWNSLFIGADAIANVMADKYSVGKAAILDPEARQSLGVRMALGETQIVSETREFLIEHGVSLDAFSQPGSSRSKTVMLAKNLPAATKTDDLEPLFSKFGTLGRLVLPPSGITAIVEYLEPSEARTAFKNLAYSKFGHIPLYLEWAPVAVFKTPPSIEMMPNDSSNDKVTTADVPSESETDESTVPGSTLFVKNLNFDTTDETLQQKFITIGKLRTATVAKKKDLKHKGSLLSMGYGFVEYTTPEEAQKAMKQLQHTILDGHQLELKVSERATISKSTSKKKQKVKKQVSNKILVRNIPFEAKLKEVKELFSVFGEIKTARLPKKVSGTGSHRGFGFVDFMSKEDAKRAFKELCHSTHLYGRRLVLEWADSEEDVTQIRKKTADHFFESGSSSKRAKKSTIMEDLKLS